MITPLKKMFAIAGLSALIAGSVLAGTYNHFISSNSTYSDTVSVPTAALCTQVGAAYSGITTISGPLGYYNLSPGNPLSLNNVPIAAGTYNIYENTSGSGYCGVVITW